MGEDNGYEPNGDGGDAQEPAAQGADQVACLNFRVYLACMSLACTSRACRPQLFLRYAMGLWAEPRIQVHLSRLKLTAERMPAVTWHALNGR